LWDFFKENRAEYDLALVPVDVKDFLEKVPAPAENELQFLFDQHKRDRYDPTSEKPGFEIPQRIKVEWVTADPASAPYKNVAKLLASLQVYPVGGYNP